jgi:hypothetical protein
MAHYSGCNDVGSMDSILARHNFDKAAQMLKPLKYLQ